MDKQLQQLIDMVKAAGPPLWSAAQHQVVAMVVSGFLWVVVLLVSAVALLYGGRLLSRQAVVVTVREDPARMAAAKVGSYHSSLNESRGEGWLADVAVALRVAAGAATLLAIGIAIARVQMLIALDYNAIQQLANLIPKP